MANYVKFQLLSNDGESLTGMKYEVCFGNYIGSKKRLLDRVAKIHFILDAEYPNTYKYLGYEGNELNKLIVWYLKRLTSFGFEFTDTDGRLNYSKCIAQGFLVSTTEDDGTRKSDTIILATLTALRFIQKGANILVNLRHLYEICREKRKVAGKQFLWDAFCISMSTYFTFGYGDASVYYSLSGLHHPGDDHDFNIYGGIVDREEIFKEWKQREGLCSLYNCWNNCNQDSRIPLFDTNVVMRLDRKKQLSDSIKSAFLTLKGLV